VNDCSPQLRGDHTRRAPSLSNSLGLEDFRSQCWRSSSNRRVPSAVRHKRAMGGPNYQLELGANREFYSSPVDAARTDSECASGSGRDYIRFCSQRTCLTPQTIIQIISCNSYRTNQECPATRIEVERFSISGVYNVALDRKIIFVITQFAPRFRQCYLLDHRSRDCNYDRMRS